MTHYNTTNLSAANNVLDFSIAANSLVDGWLFTIILVSLFMVCFIALKGKNSSADSFMASSFITLVGAGVLYTTGLVPIGPLVAVFVVFLVSLGVGMWNK